MSITTSVDRMSLLSPKEFKILENLSKLTYCNPFLPERIEFESKLLGIENRAKSSVWSHSADVNDYWEASEKISLLIQPMVKKIHGKLVSGVECTQREFELFEDLLVYHLYDELRPAISEKLEAVGLNAGTDFSNLWREFSNRVEFFTSFDTKGKRFQTLANPAHVFACYFQIKRLFINTFFCIVGSSLPAAKLRAAIWQSVITHNIRRYERSLYLQMGDIPTLISGPSGTGKELVAKSIAMSRYIPFNVSSGKFEEADCMTMQAINLAALSPTLIESELFGHTKGAFTGASHDRQGLFESCSNLGTVFLDEIGELDCSFQVNLLRVLQTRTFQRLGDLATRNFQGKVIAATNRDLAHEMSEGNFREDLYYRLCADMIETPSLREQLRDKPDDLFHLVLHLAQQLTELDYKDLASEATDWIYKNLGQNYDWPGNVRELEQCLRNIMIRGEYRPANQKPTSFQTELVDDYLGCSLTAEELLSRYCTMIYAATGSYEESARRLKMDRRTVKSKVDTELLARINAG